MVESLAGLTNLNQSSSIDGLVAQYMAIERRPVATLEAKKSDLNVRTAIYSDLKTKMQELLKLAESLSEETGSVFASHRVASSDETIATATTTGGAEGTYLLENIVLARNHRVQSAPQTSWTAAGAGSFSVNGALIYVEVGNTMADLRDAINRANYASGRGVMASVVAGRLVLEARSGGAASTLQVADVTGNTLSSLGLATTSSTIVHEDASHWQGEAGQSSWTRLIDLGSTQTVSRLSWSRDLTGASTDATPKSYTIEYLDADGVTWRTLKTVSGNTLAAGETKDDTFYPVSTSQLRLTVTATNDNQPPVIDHLAVSSDAGSFAQATLQTPQNGSLTVNGVPVTTTSNSNVTGAVLGLSLNLKQAGGPVTIEVTDDNESVTAKLKEFLTKFNALTDYLTLKSAAVPDGTGGYTRGALNGDMLFLELRSGLIRDLLGRYAGAESGEPARLADLGITMDSELHFTLTDASALADVLAGDQTAVQDLLGASTGIIQRVADRLRHFVEAPPAIPGSTYERKSLIQSAQDALGSEQRYLDERIGALNERLAMREQQLRTQLTSMQQMYIQIANQQSQLQSILSSMGGYGLY